MATEIALLPLRSDLGESVNLSKFEPYRDTIRTLKQQHGFQRVYWGTEVLDSGMLRFFVDWDSVEAHIAFTKTQYAINPSSQRSLTSEGFTLRS